MIRATVGRELFAIADIECVAVIAVHLTDGSQGDVFSDILRVSGIDQYDAGRAGAGVNRSDDGRCLSRAVAHLSRPSGHLQCERPPAPE